MQFDVGDENIRGLGWDRTDVVSVRRGGSKSDQEGVNLLQFEDAFEDFRICSSLLDVNSKFFQRVDVFCDFDETNIRRGLFDRTTI